MATLTIRDETMTGRTTGELTLDVLAETITVRELIRSRVYQEVQDYNRRRDAAAPFNGLVTPRDEERALNGPAGSRPRREIDWKRQFDVACDAFSRNGFFILIDDRQAESLDEQVTLRHDTRVSFVRLTPLVGGEMAETGELSAGAARIDADLQAYVDAVFDRPGVSLYGRVDATEFAEARHILSQDRQSRARYAVAAVEQIVAWEEAFERLTRSYVPGQPKTPERENPAVRARQLAHLFAPLLQGSVPFTRDQLLSMLGAMNRQAVLGEHLYPLTPLIKRLAAIDEPDAELRAAISGLCVRVSADHSRNAALRSAAAKLAVKVAARPARCKASRPVVRGFTGDPRVLRRLKIEAKLVPDDETPVASTTVGPDRFPLRDGSPLKHEHASWTGMYDDWIGHPHWGERNLADSESGRRILAEPPEARGRLLLALGERLVHGETAEKSWEDAPHGEACEFAARCVQALLDTDWTLPRELYFDAVLIAALARVRFYSGTSVGALQAMVGTSRRFDAERPLSDEERYALSLLRVAVIEGGMFGRDEALLGALSDLIGDETAGDALACNEAWVEKLYARIAACSPEVRAAWSALLRHAATAPTGKPSERWMKLAGQLASGIGEPRLAEALVECFTEFATERHDPVWRFTMRGHSTTGFTFGEPNATVLKGLVHSAAATPNDPGLPRAIASVAASAYRKVPGVGPRVVRLGNACVSALGRIGDGRALGQLASLKARVKFGTAQKEIEKALDAAADKLGLPRDQIEEMAVPSYGLTDVGRASATFGEFTAETLVDGTDVDVRWTDATGKTRKSLPAKAKAEHPEAVKQLRQVTKDIAAALPAQRDRIDSLFLAEKRWPASTWRDRYLNHPLVGTIARRLIWTIREGGGGNSAARTRDVCWLNGGLVDAADAAVEPDDAAEVELWHPIGRPVEDVLAWRGWLARDEVRQPFKQAHREVYLLTDAERNTSVYSNRFSAHVIRQHQFNALCAARGWRNTLRLMVDDEYPPASKDLPAFGLRAEFWVEGIGDDHGTDTTDSGAYLRLRTDQVRFYRTGAAGNLAHAGGGGYSPDRGDAGTGAINQALPLEQIPALAFSEVMRDVDLFVGVASVGNDPTWQDGGPQGRHLDYWQRYSFGELGGTAQTRRAVLESLVPRLKIRDRVSFTDRFLVVRGDKRTYKIHLGSGNILMEPNDQYLCIVPSRGEAAAGDAGAGRLFLPFEGDSTLSLILSKAFLLADDTRITDRTILSQIGR